MTGSDAWTERRRDEFVGSLKTKPGLRRYLRRTNGGLLRVTWSTVLRGELLGAGRVLRGGSFRRIAHAIGVAQWPVWALDTGG